MIAVPLEMLAAPEANDVEDRPALVAVRAEGEPCPFAEIDGEPCDGHSYSGCWWEP